MRLVFTPEGRAAIVNANNTGTVAVLVTAIGITEQAFVPNPAGGHLSLPGELKRLTTFGGVAVASDVIHVTIRDDSSDRYSLRGIGLYLEDGTLLCVYGQNEIILEKSPQALMLLAADMVLADIDATNITFGSTEFLNPPATTESLGVVELATISESENGNDPQRVVTPRGLRAFIDKRFGAAAPTDFVKGLLAMSTAVLFRAALEIKGAALKDEGHGNGLDADKLDGKHADQFAASVHEHEISNVIGLTSALSGKQPAGNYAAATHTHDINQVNGLKQELDAKSPTHAHPYLPLAGGTLTGNVDIQSASPALRFEEKGIAYSRLVALDGNLYVEGPANGRLYLRGYTGQSLSHLYFRMKTGFLRIVDDAGFTSFQSYNLTEAALAPLEFKASRHTFKGGPLSSEGGFDFGSSLKIKEIDGPLPYGLAEVRKIDTFIGRYKSSYNSDGRTRLFFDADQLASIMPEAVDEQGIVIDGDCVASIKLEQLMPPAYRAIAELAAVVDHLKSEIKELRASP